MKTSFFNLDKSVNIQADHDCGHVVYLWAVINNRTKNLCDIVTRDRAVAIRDAVEFMLADNAVSSCVTTCGVNVYRGVTK